MIWKRSAAIVAKVFKWSLLCIMKQVTYRPAPQESLNKGQELFAQTTRVRSALGRGCAQNHSAICFPKGSDHSRDDMQGLGHVRENTQPVAQLSSLSVTPYNPPFKEMSSFMVPSTLSKSTPLRSLQLKHTTKPPSADIGRPFLSVSPSFHPSDCLPVL